MSALLSIAVDQGWFISYLTFQIISYPDLMLKMPVLKIYSLGPQQGFPRARVVGRYSALKVQSSEMDQAESRLIR